MDKCGQGLVIFLPRGCLLRFQQCCGSVTFWYESGSVDPYLRLTDSVPDPAISVTDLQYGNQNLFLLIIYFLKPHLHNFLQIKSHKEDTKQ